ncbi:hypothetical protein RB195_006585 [Necator americanus]|uniref:Uncharacterized protein n=1 Tax=Necator americanus TaxID=51031 RepID=A0ABR1BTC6_NECAM
MAYYQELAWWDVIAAPICFLWFLALCYLFCITIVRHFLIYKGTARTPFLFYGEKEKSKELDLASTITGSTEARK